MGNLFTIDRAKETLKRFLGCYNITMNIECNGECTLCLYDYEDKEFRRALTEVSKYLVKNGRVVPEVINNVKGCAKRIDLCRVKCYTCKFNYTEQQLVRAVEKLLELLEELGV